jgi:hypothetical protein
MAVVHFTKWRYIGSKSETGRDSGKTTIYNLIVISLQGPDHDHKYIADRYIQI